MSFLFSKLILEKFYVNDSVNLEQQSINILGSTSYP